MEELNKKKLIAIIDDDRIFQLTASRFMESSGMVERVIQFPDGEPAIEYIQSCIDRPEELPDLLLLDINMPLADGWMFLDDFRKIISKINLKIPIVMVSSSIDPADLERVREYPEISEYVVKPVSSEKWMRILNI
jgi:two-component system chemotaxis response regulator CheY